MAINQNVQGAPFPTRQRVSAAEGVRPAGRSQEPAYAHDRDRLVRISQPVDIGSRIYGFRGAPISVPPGWRGFERTVRDVVTRAPRVQRLLVNADGLIINWSVLAPVREADEAHLTALIERHQPRPPVHAGWLA